MHWEGTLLLCAWHVIIFTFDIIRPFQDECEELLSFLRLSFFSVKKNKLKCCVLGGGKAFSLGSFMIMYLLKVKKGK